MLSPFDSFIYFSIYLVFIFSCRESLLSLTRELRRVEDSTTSHDGRVDCNIETSCLWLHVKVICFQRMQAALADERGGMGTFLEFACPTCGRREGFAFRTATLDDCLHGHPFSGIDLFPAYADCYSRRMLVQMTARWTVWLRH